MLYLASRAHFISQLHPFAVPAVPGIVARVSLPTSSSRCSCCCSFNSISRSYCDSPHLSCANDRATSTACCPRKPDDVRRCQTRNRQTAGPANHLRCRYRPPALRASAGSPCPRYRSSLLPVLSFYLPAILFRLLQASLPTRPLAFPEPLQSLTVIPAPGCNVPSLIPLFEASIVPRRTETVAP